MALNYIWIAFFIIAAAVALVKLVFFGDVEVFPAIMNATMESAKNGFEISLGLTAVLSLWMGIMKIGEQGGMVERLAKWLSPLFRRLFPEIPEGHPVMGNIFMNLSANMLGLDNAATPMGLKAMEGLQELNPKKDTASNPMIMFLVMNTAGLTIVPVSILAYRAQLGAAAPTDVFVPILLATLISMVVGVAVTGAIQRISLWNRPVLITLALFSLIVAGMAWAAQVLSREAMGVFSDNVANVILLGIIIAFIFAGIRKRINVYDAFIEGAKGGFSTAVSIIPYLIAILVGVLVAGIMFLVYWGMSKLSDEKKQEKEEELVGRSGTVYLPISGDKYEITVTRNGRQQNIVAVSKSGKIYNTGDIVKIIEADETVIYID